MRTAAAILAFVAAGASAQGAQQADACQAQIPNDLRAAVEASFPGYRTPLETDNLLEDVQYSRTHGGNGCLGVAVADFNGDRRKDFLLGLTALEGESGLGVLALATKNGWRFQEIRTFTEDARILQYVETVKPGKYERTEALDGPLDVGERDPLHCSHWGALVGRTESTGIVYCYVGGRLKYVWVSD
jgi:opacity protein-like surface antigen